MPKFLRVNVTSNIEELQPLITLAAEQLGALKLTLNKINEFEVSVGTELVKGFENSLELNPMEGK